MKTKVPSKRTLQSNGKSRRQAVRIRKHMIAGDDYETACKKAAEWPGSHNQSYMRSLRNNTNA